MTNLRLPALLFGLATILTAQSGSFSAISTYAVPSTGGLPVGITQGPDGAVWFAEYAGGGTGGEIGRITTDGTITLFPIATEEGAQGIAAGSDGNLWFTENVVGNIGRITTSGVITEFPVPFGSDPLGITAGPDGALWFTVVNGGEIGRITTDGDITEYQLPNPNSQPEGITTGPDGAIWFAEGEGGQLGRITTSGVITEFATPGNPVAIATGSDGDLWYVEAFGGIGRMTTAGVVTLYQGSDATASFQSITAGPDKALWYVTSSGYISRITTTGVVTAFSIPGPSSFPENVTAGPNGTLWFTEDGYVGQAPACALGFSPTFANGTLTMNFDLGTTTPARFEIVLHTSEGFSIPFAKTIPAIVPPQPFTLNWASLANIGKVTVDPRLLSPSTQNVMCSEWATVNTDQ